MRLSNARAALERMLSVRCLVVLGVTAAFAGCGGLAEDDGNSHETRGMGGLDQGERISNSMKTAV